MVLQRLLTINATTWGSFVRQFFKNSVPHKVYENLPISLWIVSGISSITIVTKFTHNKEFIFHLHLYWSYSSKNVSSANSPYLCALMHNVPKDSRTGDIEKEVTAIYPTATVERLFKDSKQLRTVKVQFSSSTAMQHAFRNGIRLNRLLSAAICQKLFEMFRLFYLLHLCFFLHDWNAMSIVAIKLF